MKPEIHPNYHNITVVMTDGTEYQTRSTWGKEGDKLNLDIDSKSHPAWTGGTQQMLDRGGRVARVQKKFLGVLKKDLGVQKLLFGAQKCKNAPAWPGAFFLLTISAWNYRSNAAFRRLSCGTNGLPIGARSVAGAWIVTSSLRTLLCRFIERTIRSCNCCGSFVIMSSGPGSAALSLTLVFSRLAWVSVISPSFTARCSNSHDASCIRRVVSRMLSVA